MTTLAKEVNTLLVDWVRAKEELDRLKAIEMELRRKIVEESGLFDSGKDAGTETYDLGNGYKIKAVKKINYNVDNKDGICFQVLQQIEKLGPVEAHIARELCTFKPDLKLTKYRELSPEAKRIFDTILTTSQGAPSLELVAPKGGE